MENIGTKIVKARKDHICDWCDCRIPKGHHYMCQTNVGNGEIWTWHGHLFCEEALDKIPGMYDSVIEDEGITTEHFRECLSEWLKENHGTVTDGKIALDPEWNPQVHPLSEIIKKAVREIKANGSLRMTFEPSFPDEYR